MHSFDSDINLARRNWSWPVYDEIMFFSLPSNKNGAFKDV